MEDSQDAGNIRSFLHTETSTYQAMMLYHNRLITLSMGGIFPEQPALDDKARVLDISCGPGGWVLDVAAQFPWMQVVGLDLSAEAIEYATMLSHAEGRTNATFRVTKSLLELDLPASSFDIVNERNILWQLGDKSSWPLFLQECVRVARPGGLIRLTELEVGISNSYGLQRLYGTLSQAFHKKGASFSPDGATFGIAPMLKRLLREARCRNVGHRVYGIDASFGEPVHQGWVEQLTVLDRLSTPFVVASGVATQEERDTWYRQAMAEVRAPEFACMLFFVSAWGTTPE